MGGLGVYRHLTQGSFPRKASGQLLPGFRVRVSGFGLHGSGFRFGVYASGFRFLVHEARS